MARPSWQTLISGTLMATALPWLHQQLQVGALALNLRHNHTGSEGNLP